MYLCGFRFSLLLLTFTCTLMPAASSAGPPPTLAKAPPAQTPTRSTTDPPVAAQGKLGQDLFIAVGRGDLAGVQSLLKRGADPNSRNGLLFTPLYIAAASGQTEVIEALLKAGADINASSPYGTALTFATESGIVPTIHLLLARGARSDPDRADHISTLMLAARAGAPEIVRELLDRKADVNAKDNDGATPLIYAAREGNTEAARLLLGAGATVDGSDRHRWTPLMYAAVNGHSECVQALLDKGADPNVREAKGRTPLLLAAAYGEYPDVIRVLLKQGADRHSTDAAHRTAYSVAIARGHTDSAQLLADPGAPPAADSGASRSVTKETVQRSLKAVERSMLEFNRRTGCISCHQDGLGRMATGAARERGFRLDPAVDRAQSERINGGLKALQPLHVRALADPEVMKQVPLIEIGEVATTYPWILAGMAAQKQAPNESTAAMAMVLARQQIPDGHWQFGVPRVPMQSSFFTFTALAVRSLRDYGPRAQSAEVEDRVRRAREWLINAPTQTSEDRAFRLLGLKWSGANDEQRRTATEQLRADQRPDGGWSQLPALQSDAYATGQALYALHLAGGVPVTDAAYRRGVQFLMRTQDEDGSWFVNKRAIPANNYFDSGFPHGVSQYSSFNGTCWATLALLQTVERPQRSASRPAH